MRQVLLLSAFVHECKPRFKDVKDLVILHSNRCDLNPGYVAPEPDFLTTILWKVLEGTSHKEDILTVTEKRDLLEFASKLSKAFAFLSFHTQLPTCNLTLGEN